MTENFNECYEILSNKYEEVDGEDFYRYIFPNNENSDERHEDYSMPNALYLYRDARDDGTKRRLRRRVMYNDTWQQDYMNYVEGNDMTLCSGLSYRGNTNSLEKAQRMNALIFDLDGVGRNELLSLFMRTEVPAEHFRSVPLPTFIVLSGMGLHLYYVFDKPIDLYPNIKLQLKALKYDLTFRIWEYKGTSQFKSIQYQSIVQSFRMVGSINNKYGNTVTAFKVGDKVSLAYINAYAKPENRVDLTRSFRPSKVDRATAKELYPEWYQRVVVEGNKRPKKWDIAGKVNGDNPYALYDWWKQQIGSIKGGHRYFFLMCLVIYACKCDVPEEKLRADMQEVFEKLKQIEHENSFTQEDVKSAMECYSKEYYNFTIDDIELLTDIRIVRNKRNGREQSKHMEVMRAIQNVVNPNWRNTDGRPEKKMLVWKWRQQNPNGKKIECHRDTGLSRMTIDKWWSWEPAVYEELPEHWVVEGDPQMLYELNAYAQAGIRDVAVLTPEQFQVLAFQGFLNSLDRSGKE